MKNLSKIILECKIHNKKHRKNMLKLWNKEMNGFFLVANFLLRYCKVRFGMICSKSAYDRDG